MVRPCGGSHREGEVSLPLSLSSTVWHPGSQMQLVSVDDKQLTLWKLAEAGAKVSSSHALPPLRTVTGIFSGVLGLSGPKYSVKMVHPLWKSGLVL